MPSEEQIAKRIAFFTSLGVEPVMRLKALSKVIDYSYKYLWKCQKHGLLETEKVGSRHHVTIRAVAIWSLKREGPSSCAA